MQNREYQIIVIKADRNYFYTAQVRQWWLFFRGWWKSLMPMWQPTFEDAEDLIKKHTKARAK
jgi:hypothetical protein